MLGEQFFHGFFCPAFVCAVIIALVCRPRRSEPVSRQAATLAAALGTVGGYAVGHGLIVGWSYLAPLERKDWLPCVSLIIAAVIVAEHFDALRRPWIRWSLRVAASTAAVWLVIGRPDELVLAGATLAIAGLWIAVDSLARRRAGAGPALASLIAVAAASGVLVLSGSASFGQLTGAVAACASLLALMAWRRPELTFLHGASGLFTVVPAVLWLNLQRTSYIGVSTTSALLLAAAMVSGWVGELAAVRRMRPWPRAGVYVTAALVPAALALLAAWSAYEPSGEYEY